MKKDIILIGACIFLGSYAMAETDTRLACSDARGLTSVKERESRGEIEKVLEFYANGTISVQRAQKKGGQEVIRIKEGKQPAGDEWKMVPQVEGLPYSVSFEERIPLAKKIGQTQGGMLSRPRYYVTETFMASIKIARTDGMPLYEGTPSGGCSLPTVDTVESFLICERTTF
jgi:hypothetical protein